MSQESLRQYEGMFVFDPTFGSSFDNCEREIQRLLERAEGEILVCRKWDDRRLAYRIDGHKRGVYVLVYFRAPPSKIRPLERDAQLSEPLLRLLVLQAEGVTREDMEKAVRTQADTGAERVAPEKAAARDEPKKTTPVLAEAPAGKAGEPEAPAAPEAKPAASD